MIYFVPILIAIVGLIFYSPNRNYIAFRRFYLFLLLINILLFGLRYRVGGDTLNYMQFFSKRCPTIDGLTLYNFADSTTAPLFIILMSICKTIYNDFVLFQMVHSIVLNCAVFYFLRKHSGNPFFSYILFYAIIGLYFNMEILKETFAISMFLIGYEYMISNDWKKYYICAVIAVGFHYGAIILFFIPFLMGLRLNKKFVIFCAVFLISLSTIFTFVVGNIDNQALADRVSRYQDMVGQGTLNINYVYGALIQFDLVPFIVLLFGRNSEEECVYEFEPFVCLFIVMGLGTISYQVMFQRYCNYFYPFFIVYFSNLVSEKIKYHFITCIALLCLLLFMPIRGNTNPNTLSRWVPYHSVFKPEKEPIREYGLRVK